MINRAWLRLAKLRHFWLKRVKAGLSDVPQRPWLRLAKLRHFGLKRAMARLANKRNAALQHANPEMQASDPMDNMNPEMQASDPIDNMRDPDLQ